MPKAIPGAVIIPGVFNGICQDYQDNDTCTAMFHMCSVCPDRKKDMETIRDVDILRNVIWDDAEGYRLVKEMKGDLGRWHEHIESVFVRESDGKLFITDWQREHSENGNHEYPEIAYEAEEYSETVTKYRRILQSQPAKAKTK